MTRIIIITILLFNSLYLYPQTDEDRIMTLDSSQVKQNSSQNLDLNFLINKAEFLRYTTLQQNNTGINSDNSKLWLQSKVVLNKNFFAFDKDELPYEDLLSPLMQQYQSKQKMAPLYYILGTAQTAAVGYLAYKHIKKYGFK
jgi:hypothetical protein